MRTFFLLLVLLNLSYFALGKFIPSVGGDMHSRQSAGGLPPGVQALHLIKLGTEPKPSTMEARTVASAATAAAVSAGKQSAERQVSSVAPPPLCFSLGPFGAKASATAMVGAFDKRGVNATVRKIEQTQVVGYWVYLPPSHSMAAAIELTHKLRAKGFKDFYIVSAAPYTYAVSLGLFHERDGMERRITQVRKLGFHPKLQVRTAVNELYWLDYRDPGNGAISPELWAHGPNNDASPLQRVRRECKAPQN